MAALIPPGQRLAAAAAAGDAPALVEAAYDLGLAAAFHAIRAQGEIAAQWPGALEVANAKVDELLTRFRVGQSDEDLPTNPAAYVFASVRRAVHTYMGFMTSGEVPEPELGAAGDEDEVELAPELMRQLIANGDYEAATVLAVARDLAERGERPSARAIHAEIVVRHNADGARDGPARWRVDKAWSRVRLAARHL